SPPSGASRPGPRPRCATAIPAGRWGTRASSRATRNGERWRAPADTCCFRDRLASVPIADDIARAELEDLRQQGLLRAIEPLRSPPGPEIELRPGERLINFSSNDYL